MDREEALLTSIKRNPFLLAPMAGITDAPFRSFMRAMGCGVVTTELVSATGLKYSSKKTHQLMQFSTDQHPIGIQLFGESIDNLVEAAKAVEQMGADFVDLNFGCPVPKVVKRGAGSAALKDLVALSSLLRSVKSAITIPLTIKVRTGWDENTRNTDRVAQLAFDEGISWMAIHGRTRAQGYSGRADWEYIGEIKEQAKLPIIGNGDLISPEQAAEKLFVSRCDGVMIGRGCLKNPWIFVQSLEIRRSVDKKISTKPDFIEMFRLLRHYLELDSEERVILLQTKKLSAWFSGGHKDSARFRKRIFEITEVEELYSHIEEFFSDIVVLSPSSDAHSDFLMGGHG